MLFTLWSLLRDYVVFAQSQLDTSCEGEQARRDKQGGPWPSGKRKKARKKTWGIKGKARRERKQSKVKGFIGLASAAMAQVCISAPGFGEVHHATLSSFICDLVHTPQVCTHRIRPSSSDAVPSCVFR